MALVASANGQTYRLRNARFTISGPTPAVLDGEDDPDATELDVVLNAGSYTVLLESGWVLERLDPGGPVEVTAALISPNPASFEIEAAETTRVAFRFATDGTIVVIGSGTLSIDIEVIPEAPPGELSLLAGRIGGPGSIDGVGAGARFSEPSALALGGDGSVYVADSNNNAIRAIDLASGSVTTLAGQGADGLGGEATFNFPSGIASDGFGMLYIADTFNCTIDRLVIATGEVTTLAGSQNGFGSDDGVGEAARFSFLDALAIDGAGMLYVADTDNHTIRRVDTLTGVVTTLAGSPGVPGHQDGIGGAALFERPRGIASDGIGRVFVTDASSTVRQIEVASGEVTTLAGAPGERDAIDGVGALARFRGPRGLVQDGDSLFVADNENHTIRRIVLDTAEVTTLAGSALEFGSADGAGADARFDGPRGLASDGAGTLFVADAANTTVRRVDTATASVTTLAGAAFTFGSADGRRDAARFAQLAGLANDGAGRVYAADLGNSTLRVVDVATGEVTTLAGSPQVFGGEDGIGAEAQFGGPASVALDGLGNLYVSDTRGNTLRKVVLATREVTTVAGVFGTFGSADGIGAAARFAFPRGLVIVEGDLFVADSLNNTIRRVDPDTAEVTTFVGIPEIAGSADGDATVATFRFPNSVSADGAGNLYVADTSSNTIRQVDMATRTVTTLAGSTDVPGSVDGVGSAALFTGPSDLTFAGGFLYVVDEGNSAIRRIDPATREVTTLVGRARERGVVLGALPGGLNLPAGITVLPNAAVVISDMVENALLIARP